MTPFTQATPLMQSNNAINNMLFVNDKDINNKNSISWGDKNQLVGNMNSNYIDKNNNLVVGGPNLIQGQYNSVFGM